MKSIQLEEFDFAPLTEDDYPLLLSWVNMPHMAGKWNAAHSLEDIRSQFDGKIGSDWQQAYIVSLNGQRFAYIQSYRAAKAGTEWWPNEPETTMGIDQFIGEPSFLDRGIGTKLVQVFSDWLLSESSVKKVITDPAIDNHRAIKCYRKAGFREVNIVDTPDGKELLMEKSGDNPT